MSARQIETKQEKHNKKKKKILLDRGGREELYMSGSAVGVTKVGRGKFLTSNTITSYPKGVHRERIPLGELTESRKKKQQEYH